MVKYVGGVRGVLTCLSGGVCWWWCGCRCGEACCCFCVQ